MNVINDPWLYVKYLDGHSEQVSVRQAFKDADKIKCLETPNFHNTSIYIYEVGVIQLLVTILEAAYFKPETNFEARNKHFAKHLLNDGWDEEMLFSYLDKWQDRFNLFDNKYPFMQDISLKPKNNYTVESNNFISRTSIATPAANNIIFEHSIKADGEYITAYKSNIYELVYNLLYTNIMTTSPAASQYPNKTLCTNATMFLLVCGKNLRETIIYNCLPLRNSNNDEDTYDRPVWEFDNVSQIKNFEPESLGNNILLCTFFPCNPVYVVYDNEIKDFILSKKFDTRVLKSKLDRDALARHYVQNNPWGIKTTIEEKDGESFDKYKEWTKSIKLISLCIDITKRCKSGFGCNLISSDYQENKGAQCTIYYRQYDGMKTNVLSFGKYEIAQEVFDKLQEDSNHEKAIKFQELISKIQVKFKEFNNAGFTSKIIEDVVNKFAKHAESYFFKIFVQNVEQDDVIKTTTDYLVKYAKNLARNLSELSANPLRYANAYKKFSGSINKLKEE